MSQYKYEANAFFYLGSLSDSSELNIISSMAALIDRVTGAVRISDDLILTPGLPYEKVANYVIPVDRSKLEKSVWLAPFTMGSLYGVLDISLHFKKGVLDTMKGSLRSEFGPQQALIKGRHDGFLTELLGRPTMEQPLVRTIADRLFVRALGQDWPRATKELTWTHRWGTVVSSVELRDGLAEFLVIWDGK